MLARTTTGINLGQLLLLPLAGWLIAQYGTSAAYLMLGGLVLITAVPVAAFVLRDSPADLGQHVDGLPVLLGPAHAQDSPASSTSFPTRSEAATAAVPAATPGAAQESTADAPVRMQTRVVASFAMHALSLYLVVLHLPRYAADLGGSVSAGAQALAVAAVASGVTMLLTGRLTERLGRRRLLLGLHAVRAVALLIGAVCSTPAQLFVFAILFGIASFPVIPLTVAVLSAGQDPDRLGRVMGRVWLLHQVSAGVGVLAAGLTRSWAGSYRPSFAVGAVLMVCGCLLLHRVTDPASSPADLSTSHP